MKKSFELVYRIGVAVKGFDGLVELLAGLILWLFPHALEHLLRPLAVVVGGHHPVRNFLGYWAGRMDHELSGGSHEFVIIFLIGHGVVKLVLVYCLFREYHWVYPYALVVLGLFTAYQVYVLIKTPSIGMVLFTILDVVIMWLVWREWRILKAKAQSPEVSTGSTSAE